MLSYPKGLDTGKGKKAKAKRPASGGKVHSETPMRSCFGKSDFARIVLFGLRPTMLFGSGREVS